MEDVAFSSAVRDRHLGIRPVTVESLEPHAYVQTTSPDYLLTLLSRGMSAAGRAGEIGQTMVESFNAEARRRVANRTFFGSLTFLSVIARRDQ
jgi:arsenite methyltransferase